MRYSVESVRLGKSEVIEGTKSELFGVVNRERNTNSSIAAQLVLLIQVASLQSVSVSRPANGVESSYQVLHLRTDQGILVGTWNGPNTILVPARALHDETPGLLAAVFYRT